METTAPTIESVKANAKEYKDKLEWFAKTTIEIAKNDDKITAHSTFCLFRETLEAYVQARIFLALKAGEVELS